MAKGNMLLGTLTGSIGDVTFYRRQGVQCERPRIRKIKNPRSTGQLIQRTILSTVAGAYRFFQPIADHSFQGVQQGAKSQAAFNKENLDRLRKVVARNVDYQIPAVSEHLFGFATKGSQAVTGRRWMISRGTLNLNANYIGSVQSMPIAAGGINYTMPQALIVSASSAESTPTSVPSVADVCQYLGMNVGDQLSLVVVCCTSEETDQYGGELWPYFQPYELQLTRLIWEPSQAALPVGIGSGTTLSLNTEPLSGASLNPGPWSFSYEEVSTGSYAWVLRGDGVWFGDYYMGAIRSQLVGGVWRRSTCIMPYIPQPAQLFDAVASYLASSIDVENDAYLNNATTAVGVEGSAVVDNRSDRYYYVTKGSTTFEGRYLKSQVVEIEEVEGNTEVIVVAPTGSDFVTSGLSSVAQTVIESEADLVTYLTGKMSSTSIDEVKSVFSGSCKILFGYVINADPAVFSVLQFDGSYIGTRRSSDDGTED